jgi:hypothetical protein
MDSIFVVFRRNSVFKGLVQVLSQQWPGETGENYNKSQSDTYTGGDSNGESPEH